MALSTYSPQKVAMAIAGIPIDPSDFGQEYIRITYNNDQFSLRVGAGGGATRAQTGDRSATIEVTLKHGSNANTRLSALHNNDLANGTGGIGPFSMALMDSGTPPTHTHKSRNVWVKKFPDVTLGQEGPEYTWVLETDQLESTLGTSLRQA